MTLEQYAYLGDIIAAIAVIITLIYLAVQIRENSRETRASTTQQVLDSEMFLASQYVEHADIWEKVVSGLPLESSTERRQAINLFQLAILTSENTYHQFNDGYVDAEYWEARVDVLRLLVRMPTYRFWRESPGGVSRSRSFLAFLDSLAEAIEN